MENNIEYDLADVIIGRPHAFTVGSKRFCLYPVTLAKTYLLKRQMDSLGVNETQLIINPIMETLRLVEANRETCCRILAYHTAPNTKKDLFDNRAITIRKNFFEKEMDDEDLASLMFMVLYADKTEQYIKHLGIDKEREKLNMALKVKNKSEENMMSFCGCSIFGTFIGQLKELGYSDDEILFEKGYSYLRLMLADKVVTIHLSKEERAELPEWAGGSYIDASDPSNADKILEKMKKRGVATVDNLDN